MPLYEFMCRRCKKEFEANQSVDDHGKVKPSCPSCSSTNQVEPEVSRFFAQTRRKS